MNRHLKALQALMKMSLNLTYHHRTMTSLLLVVHSRRLTNIVLAARMHPSHRLVMLMNAPSSIHVVYYLKFATTQYQDKAPRSHADGGAYP